jgi:hypothetical protein
MSAKRYRNRSEGVAAENYKEALQEARGGESLSSGQQISAYVTEAEEGRVLIPRPDAGAATNAAAPAVCPR